MTVTWAPEDTSKAHTLQCVLRVGRYYRARCTCGSYTARRVTEDQARESQRKHEEAMA